MTNRTDLRALWNAVLSMNTLAEFVALHRLGYPLLTRKELDEKAKTIREEVTILETLKQCAETLKHVRKLNNDTKPSLMSDQPSRAKEQREDRNHQSAKNLCAHSLPQ